MALTPRIAAVSYLSTIPFIYGIRREGNLRADLLLTASPALCAQQFIDGNADIALVPSAVVPQLKSAEIVTDYCIGAESEMRTEVLVSNTPIEEVHRVWLDMGSPASVQLVGYLASKVWKVAPEWLPMHDAEILDTPQDGDAFLLVGDTIFDHEDEFIYTYDLAAEWHEATGMPFAFAVWVARRGTPYEVTDALQQSLTFGLERIYESLVESDYAERPYAYDYLTQDIDYLFDNEKRKALQKFWTSGIKVTPRVEPG